MLPDSNGQGRALLVCVNFGQAGFSARVTEAEALIAAAGLTCAGTVTAKRDKPDAALFLGSGKVDEIKIQVEGDPVDWVVFDHELTPIQGRNLERVLNVRVADRSELILDIFAQRARSGEGKLQVELARLTHLATRLVRGWTHLERQRGGIGVRGGPGETQLEIDRRLITDRVKLLKTRIAKLERQRATQRKHRARRGVMRVALVGYTNAGKSTLFNRLTRAGALVADQLFATLDTTTRRLRLPSQREVVLSDTVGFIRDLPHTLITAFHATLEETADADLLLHVVDASDPAHAEHMVEVDKVLDEIGAANVARLIVFNKCDQLEAARVPVSKDPCGNILEVSVSAAAGMGMGELLAAIDRRLAAPHGTASELVSPPNIDTFAMSHAAG